jgi:hypothetical protein
MDVGSKRDVVSVVDVNLGFSKVGEVIENHEGGGLKRAITRPLDYDFDRRFEYRRHLHGAVFPLSGGKCLKLLHVAPEGLIMRGFAP